MPSSRRAPPQAEMQRAPHRLYGTVPASEAYSVRPLGSKMRRALCARRQARDACRSSSAAPASISRRSPKGLPLSPTCRRRSAPIGGAEAERLGTDGLHRELQARDPVMAARLRPSDPQRIVRALEVIDATGVSLAEWQGADAAPVLEPDAVLKLVIAPEREPLYAAIDARFDRMIEAGRHRGGAGASRARPRSRPPRDAGAWRARACRLSLQATAASKRRSRRPRPRAAAMPSGR